MTSAGMVGILHALYVSMPQVTDRLFLLCMQHQQQQEELPSDSNLQHTTPSIVPGELPSSRRSSTSGAGQSDNEDGVFVQKDSDQPNEPARQRDKDWAALTTWLRMNLHHVSCGCVLESRAPAAVVACTSL